METAAFLRGMGAGLAVGAAIGLVVEANRTSMKTGVGRTMQHMGSAMDTAVHNMMH